MAKKNKTRDRAVALVREQAKVQIMEEVILRLDNMKSAMDKALCLDVDDAYRLENLRDAYSKMLASAKDGVSWNIEQLALGE